MVRVRVRDNVRVRARVLGLACELRVRAKVRVRDRDRERALGAACEHLRSPARDLLCRELDLVRVSVRVRGTVRVRVRVSYTPHRPAASSAGRSSLVTWRE